MATVYWIGGASRRVENNSVAENTYHEVSFNVSNYSASTTYVVDIAGVEIAVVGRADEGTTENDFVATWNAASEGPVAWITATKTGGDIHLTADNPGVPFTVTLSVEGGTGTWSALTTDYDVEPESATSWSNPRNWSGGAVPVAADDVIFSNGSVPCLYGLDQSGVTLASLTIDQSYTGKIGLYKGGGFSTSADGSTVVTDSGYENRDEFLQIGLDRR